MDTTNPSGVLSAAQRARAERNRLRARALQDARVIKCAPVDGYKKEQTITNGHGGRSRAVDTGGGFLLEEDDRDDASTVSAAPTTAPAPLVHPSVQPRCLQCGSAFPQSYLFDTFDYAVCDECRDDEDKHALITRTDAKSEYLLQDCDLDLRPPPLRYVRRRNPHRARYADMRLYLRPQVEQRAIEVWDSLESLEAERTRRGERRDKARETAARKKLRALRMDVRGSLFSGVSTHHQHEWGPEQQIDGDNYSRSCITCDHSETYEKM